MPVIVVLDTSALHGDVYAKGSWLATLFGAAAERPDLEVWTPAVVVEELVRQFPERLAELRRTLRGHRHDVRAFGWQFPELPKDVDTEAMAYRPALTGRLRGRGRRIADHPAEVATAIEWVARRRKPVKSDGRGAVDAAIWLTVLEAVAGGSEVVLVSANTQDFADPEDMGKLHEVLLGDLDALGIDREQVWLLPRVLDVNKALIEPPEEAIRAAEELLADPTSRAGLEEQIAAAVRWLQIGSEEAGGWLKMEIDDAVLEDFLAETIDLVRADPLPDNSFYATLEVHGTARLELGLHKGEAARLQEGSRVAILDWDWNESMARGEAEIPFYALVDARVERGRLRVAVEEIGQDR